MKLDNLSADITVVGGEVSSSFSIAMNGKAFKVLSDTLYQDKIGSMVREVSCNARDSHVAAGKADVPFEIHLPDNFEPWFSVKDYGLGLSHEDVKNVFTVYFHFCSYDYLKHFGGSRIMVLEINPADVVAIPADYNNSKGRTCRYKVVDEIEVNEYNMPSKQITEGYTDEYSEEDTEDSEQVQDSIKPNPSAKLTEQDVKQIRAIYDKFVDKSLAVQHLTQTYNISRRQLMRIINREAWKNVH